MSMVYQKGSVYEKGKRVKKWYGKFRVYTRDKEGKEVVRTQRVVLGLKSQLRKHEAENKLQNIIQKENGEGGPVPFPKSDDSVTFGWFVADRYLPMCRGRWRQATKDKSEFEIKKYLVSRFQDSPLAKIGTFEIQMLLNDLAQEFSESIVKHAFVNIRSIMRMAKKLKFIADDPGDGTRMPETKAVSRPTMTAQQIIQLIDSISDPHDLCLISIGLFCATRTSETFGLQWKCYVGDKLIIHSTAYEGSLFPGKVKTNASGSAVPVPDDIRPIIEAWKEMCQDTSPDSLMFATTGRNGSQVPRRPKNFLKWRIYPIAHRLGIPRRLVTFQVMRRTVGTDLQKHGTIKDAQQILRHANIQTTGNVYMQEIPASVVAAINSRTREILANRKRNLVKLQDPTGSNGLQLAKWNKVSA